MNKKDVATLFKFLRSVYSSFEVDQYKIDTWSHLLKGQNPAIVMKNAERHVLESKFAPTIADIRETYHPSYNNNVLEEMKQWELEASEK